MPAALEKKINYKDLEHTKERIFFVLGTSRSGTTLLQSMLNSHSKITIPPETHFFYGRDYLDKELSGKDIDEQQKLIDFWYNHKTRMRDLGLDVETVKAYCSDLNLSSPDELFNLQLTMYRIEREKEIVGEKTPRHIRHVDEILNVFPKAKIISLFRDPRATALSELKAYFGSPSVIVTTKRWREYVQKHFELQKRIPTEQYKMVRYCDLIQFPEQTLQEITRHIGVEFEPEMLEYHNRDGEEKGFAPGEHSWKQETLEPLKKNKNRYWKEQLTGWQIALVENVAGEWLNKMGYKPQGVKLNPLLKAWYSTVDFGRSVIATLTNARDEGYYGPKDFKN